MAKERMTRYYKVKNEDNKFLKAEIYYSLGGYNHFTSKMENRGYYISVLPVEKAGRLESYTSFTGLKQNILQCERKSKKRLEEAVAYFEKYIDEFISLHFSEFDVDLTQYE